MVTATIICVLVTNVLLGPLTAPIVRRLGLQRASGGGDGSGAPADRDPRSSHHLTLASDLTLGASSPSPRGGNGCNGSTNAQPLLPRGSLSPGHVIGSGEGGEHALPPAASDCSVNDGGLAPLVASSSAAGGGGGGGRRELRPRRQYGYLHAAWKAADQRWLKPVFGGRGAPGCPDELEVDDDDE